MRAIRSGDAVRVGVVGGGRWGTYHLLAARELEARGEAQLVAVATRTKETAAKQSEAFGLTPYTDYRAMIEQEEIDAVTVATPDHLHRQITLFALSRGKHVLVEKPMDLSTAGCVEMLNAAEHNELLLQVDFHKRYDPYNIDAMRKVREGKIGQPQYAYAYMEDRITVPSEWLAGWAAQTTPFWFIGIHKYDLVRWISGQEAVSVVASARKGKLASLGLDTYDSVSAFVAMDGGMTCTIDVNWILPPQFEAVVNQGLRMVGSDGLIELDSQDRGLRYCFSSDGIQTANLGAFLSLDSPYGWKAVKGYFVDAVKDFLRNVRYLKAGGSLGDLKGHYPSAWDGLQATKLAEAVQMSIETGRAVRIAEIEEAIHLLPEAPKGRLRPEEG